MKSYTIVLYIQGVTESIKITLGGFEFLKTLDWSVKRGFKIDCN